MKAFLSILMAGLIFVCTAPVAAQDNIPTFHPQYAWTVSDGANGQCVLSTQFNNGFTIQVVQPVAAQTPSTFNIDFAQDVFEINQSYDVNLSIPGQAAYDLKARSSNGRALAASLAQAQDMMTALQTANAFDLAVDDNKFRFLANGLADGVERFQGCLTKDKAPESPVKADEAKTPVAKAEKGLQKPAEKPLEPIDLLERPEPVPIQEIIPPQPDVQGYEFSDSKDVEALPDVSEDRPEMTADKKDYLEKIQSGFEEGQPQNSVALPSAKPEPPEPIVKKIASTEIKTTTEKTKVEVDLTQVFDTQQTTGDEPFSKKGVLMKTAKREKKNSTSESSALPSLDAKSVEPVTAVPAGERIKPKPEAPYEAPYIEVHNDPKPIPSDAAPPSHSSDELRALRKKVKMLEQQNLMLDTELKQTLKNSEQERVAVASENWNLERATLRYNEAERQIKKLGREIQKQRASCLADKQELEAMLFDPASAGQIQNDELRRIREENEALKARINVLEGR